MYFPIWTGVLSLQLAHMATVYLGGYTPLSTFLTRIGVAPTASYLRIDIGCILRERNLANQACAGDTVQPGERKGAD